MMKRFTKVGKTKQKILAKLRDNSGQGTLDTAFQILIGVVLAAMLLAGLYALLGDTVLPLLAEKVKNMFNYTH